ncbi:MAG: glycoside hydrolase family 28 protein [Kangiellaceae bacterium]|nr:glycoside hydrolase family 28 protein [Kangiellaceae bacterium]
MDSTRRLLLKGLTASAVLPLTSCGLSDQSSELLAADDWVLAKNIRLAIQSTSFARRTLQVSDFGAQNNGEFDNTEAFKNAISECHRLGGGRVNVAPGEYSCGPIHLLSNVNLHLQEGAMISFNKDPKKYLPEVLTRWEGLELMGYSPLVYAYKQENIAITGKGVLNGNADNQTWWPWKGPRDDAHWDLIKDEDQKVARQKLMKDAEDGVPVAERVYGDGAFLRPPLFQPYGCERVLVEDVTIKNSPFWLLNPVLCKHVTVKGVSFLSHGPNSDGCNPESCDHVLIENCTFDTGDDCIAIKSGRNADGRRLATPSQNIVIADCNMKDGHGGVVIGSEISGGVNNVFVENCVMNSPHLERVIRIKTNSVRGGLIEHIRVRNIEVGTVQNAIVINFFYEEGDKGKFDPIVRDIKIENLNCNNILDKALHLQGFERAPIQDFNLENCQFRNVKNKSIVQHVSKFSLVNVSINGSKVSADQLLNQG